jgi:hypothetical protein
MGRLGAPKPGDGGRSGWLVSDFWSLISFFEFFPFENDNLRLRSARYNINPSLTG